VCLIGVGQLLTSEFYEAMKTSSPNTRCLFILERRRKAIEKYRVGVAGEVCSE
jgi:hypothetical protein